MHHSRYIAIVNVAMEWQVPIHFNLIVSTQSMKMGAQKRIAEEMRIFSCEGSAKYLTRLAHTVDCILMKIAKINLLKKMYLSIEYYLL